MEEKPLPPLAPDPVIDAKINRNVIEARKAARQIAHAFRKKPPHEQIEAMVNTVGIMCAEMLYMAALVGDPKDKGRVEAVEAILLAHMAHANAKISGA